LASTGAICAIATRSSPAPGESLNDGSMAGVLARPA
jgi:hypothetical protein